MFFTVKHCLSRDEIKLDDMQGGCSREKQINGAKKCQAVKAISKKKIPGNLNNRQKEGIYRIKTGGKHENRKVQ